jgi:hypothetical protein
VEVSAAGHQLQGVVLTQDLPHLSHLGESLSSGLGFWGCLAVCALQLFDLGETVVLLLTIAWCSCRCGCCQLQGTSCRDWCLCRICRT